MRYICVTPFLRQWSHPTDPAGFMSFFQGYGTNGWLVNEPKRDGCCLRLRLMPELRVRPVLSAASSDSLYVSIRRRSFTA